MSSVVDFGKFGLDSKDLAIMYALDLNSRQPTAAIAKKLAIDKSVVNYRINKLIEQNFILGFYALIDAPRLGLEGFRIYLKYENTDEAVEKQIIDFFVESKAAWWVGSIDGAWDIGIVLWLKDIYELRELWMKFNEKYGRFIQQKAVSAYTHLHDFPYAFLSPKKLADIPMHLIGGKETEGVSEAESKVLRALAQNCRMPTVEIAKKTGLTAIQVKYAIRKMLESRVIKGFRTMFNLQKLGLVHYKVDISLSDKSKFGALVSFAGQNPNIIYVDESIGGSDFEIEAVVQSHAQVHGIMQEMREKFPNTIKNYTYYIYSKIHKIRYF
jgi:DNA-binding Lrp family transcriptional regulator